MSTVQQSKSDVLSRVSIVLDELQSLMSTLYTIRDDSSDANSISDSVSSFEDDLWWDDSCLTTAYSTGNDSCADDSLDSSSCSNESVSTDDEVLYSLTFTDLSPCPSPDVSHHDDFVSMMSASIKTIAPELRYSSVKARRKRRKAKMKRVHPELRRMWANAATIVSPVSKVPPAPTQVLPTVDWSQVNKRFLSNIPTPSHHSIQGCSQDEDLYKVTTWCGQTISPRFERPSPFGTMLGYKTTEGIISFNEDQCFHGYAYDKEEGWILQAKYVHVKKKKRTLKKKLRKI